MRVTMAIAGGWRWELAMAVVVFAISGGCAQKGWPD